MRLISKKIRKEQMKQGSVFVFFFFLAKMGSVFCE